MPKVDPKYLKNAVLECRQQIKQKGRDPQGRSYVSSPECRMLRALLLETLDQSRQMLTKLNGFTQKTHLQKIISELEPIITCDIRKRYPEAPISVCQQKAHEFSVTLARNYFDTCHYYARTLRPQLEQAKDVQQKFIASEKPLSYSQKRKIRELRFQTVPLCQHLMDEWELFCKAIEHSKQAMKERKPLDRLGILKFNELVQHGTRKI